MATGQSNYLAYRGKCKEIAQAAVDADSSLRLVRGYYFCPMWGKQAHWWAERPDGTVVDPTVKQFPTAGVGAAYVEFDGNIECEHCNKSVPEIEAYRVDRHVYCSDQCYSRDIGF